MSILKEDVTFSLSLYVLYWDKIFVYVTILCDKIHCTHGYAEDEISSYLWVYSGYFVWTRHSCIQLSFCNTEDPFLCWKIFKLQLKSNVIQSYVWNNLSISTHHWIRQTWHNLDNFIENCYIYKLLSFNSAIALKHCQLNFAVPAIKCSHPSCD